MNRLTLLCIITFFWSALQAQTKGVVLDVKSSRPLAGVHIYMQRDSSGITITNENGSFETRSLTKVGAQEVLVFSYVGYEPLTCTIQELKKQGYRVRMHESSQHLGQVTVQAKKYTPFLDYTFLAPLPKALYSFGSFLSGGKIYVIAGDETQIETTFKDDDDNFWKKGEIGTRAWEYYSADMYIYDIAKDLWTKEKQKFASRACHAAHLYNNKVFILGGKRYSANRRKQYTDATMEVYDLIKDTLYLDPVNPHQAVGFSSFIYDDHLYIVGGSVKQGVFSDKIHALDLKSGVWYEMGSIPEESRREMNTVLVGHVVYFIGGHRKTPMWEMESYDLLTGEWKRLCKLKEGVAYPGLAVYGDLIYIYENKTLQVYNVRDNSIRSYLLNLDLESAGLFYFDGLLYIVGGCVREGSYIYPAKGVYAVDVKQMSQD